MAVNLASGHKHVAGALQAAIVSVGRVLPLHVSIGSRAVILFDKKQHYIRIINSRYDIIIIFLQSYFFFI